MTSYTATIRSSRSAEDIYQAISEEMSDWWTPMSKKFLNVGDKAKTDFGGSAYWVFEASLLNKPDQIVLTCCEANYQHADMTEDMREEWLGTHLIFNISQEDDHSIVEFIHQGLTPDMGCYSVCKGGWDHYILNSLNDYLNDKSGKPNTY